MKNPPNSGGNPAGLNGATGSDVTIDASLDQFALIVHWKSRR